MDEPLIDSSAASPTERNPVPTPPPSEPAPSLRPVEEVQALCDAATEGADVCWCEPVITEEGRGVVVTHKDALDRWHDAELSRPIPFLGSKD